MKETISICKRNEKGNLVVMDERVMVTDLDEKTMELYVKYQGQRYTVDGNIHMAYIVVN